MKVYLTIEYIKDKEASDKFVSLTSLLTLKGHNYTLEP